MSLRFLKKISPKTFGAQCVYQSLSCSLLNTIEIKRRHIQTQATQICLMIFMQTEAALCMVATFIYIKCPLQLVQMDFSLLPYLSIIKLIICFFQVLTCYWICTSTYSLHLQFDFTSGLLEWVFFTQTLICVLVLKKIDRKMAKCLAKTCWLT